MISKVQEIIPDAILTFLKKKVAYNNYTYKLALAWKFRKRHNYVLNLQCPKTFNERFIFHFLPPFLS